MAFCREHMEEEKIPAAIHLLPALPRGVSGKVQLKAIREQLVEHVTRAAGAGPDFRALVWESAASSFKVPLDQLHAGTNSHSMAGWDSMAHLDFVVRLEKALGTEFSTAEIMVMNSLQNAEEVARKKFTRR